MTARTPIERGAEALMSPVHAPMTDHDPRDGSCVSCPWPLSEAGTPEDIARAVLEAALDVEGLAGVIEHHQHFESIGADRACECGEHLPAEGPSWQAHATHVATAIRAYLLGTDEGGA